MRTRRFRLLLLTFCVAALADLTAKPQRMSVQLRSDVLRATPEFMTKSVGTIKYADVVTVLETKGAWVKVQSPSNKTGWVHISALSKKTIKATAGDTEASKKVSSGEMASATKGFSPEAEAGFRKNNPKISFAAVDKMEKTKVSLQDVEAFLKAGRVEGPKGGAK